MSSETLPTEATLPTETLPIIEPPKPPSKETIAAAAQAALLGTGDPSVTEAGF